MTVEQILPWVLLSIVAFAAWWIFRPSARSRKTDFRVITASAVLVLMTGGFIFWQSGFRSAGTLDWEELDQRSEYRIAFQEALQPAIDFVLLEDLGIVTTTPLLLSAEELQKLRDLLRSQMESRFGEAPPEMASAVPDLSNPGEGDGGPSLQSKPPKPHSIIRQNQYCEKGEDGAPDECKWDGSSKCKEWIAPQICRTL